MEKGWNQFFDEIRSIVPDAKVGDQSNELTREELFLLLIHAHRKVSTLQKNVAKLEVNNSPICSTYRFTKDFLLLKQLMF